MAMVELATRQGGCGITGKPGFPPPRPVSLADIAQGQHLSVAYLEQLFGHLRRAGLVASARGPGGGYRLARPPEQIAMAEIIEAVDEPLRATRCEEGSPGCLAGQRCLTHDLWEELGEQIRLFLTHVTLEDVIAGRIAGRAQPPGIQPAPPRPPALP